MLSGIPFSILEINKKRQLLQKTYDALKPGGDFVIYQVTNELRRHATPAIFPRADSEYFLQNVPPMFITVFHKDGVPAGKDGGAVRSSNGHSPKGKKNRPLAANRSRR